MFFVVDRKPVDPLRARKEELKERLQQLNDMPPDTRGATPKTATSVREAFPSRPRTAPGDADAVPAKSGEGSGFGGLRRPSTASTSRRRTMSVKDEIEAVEQELHEIELKLRFKKVSY